MNYLAQYKELLGRTIVDRVALMERFISVRGHSLQICAPLENEDFVVQPCREVSPPKWHLGHTTWFFEELLLVKFKHNYQRFNNDFPIIFNSYYKAAGKHWSQSERGELSRPTVKEVFDYRKQIEATLMEFLREAEPNPEIDFLLEVGLHHEQQHQELLLMDIKYILSCGPSYPVYSQLRLSLAKPCDYSWKKFDEGIYNIGHDDTTFAYDNEGPCHKEYIHSFSMATVSVSNGEFLEFMEQKGYEDPKFWLSEGWDWINQNQVNCPLYWRFIADKWHEFTLHGLQELDLNAPVSHVSYFEADAFANWTGKRLPTESELEIYFKDKESTAKPFDHATACFHSNDREQSTNQQWYWSRSHYSPYPGYRTFPGMIGEYNGKFMCNQFVLRGGSVVTSPGHHRITYRNFFAPHQRWMFSGIRLAKDNEV